MKNWAVTGGIFLAVACASLLGVVGLSSKLDAQTQTNVRPSQTTQPLNVLVTDCSITIAFTGVPQRLVPANAGRKFISFQTQPPQTGTIPTIGYSYTNTTPTLGVTGTFTLYPGATGGHESVSIPSNSVYVIGPQGTVISCAQG